MDYCSICEFYDECELADGTNFCEDCADCDICTIKSEYCKAGHCVECNNGFELKSDCLEEEDECEYCM